MRLTRGLAPFLCSVALAAPPQVHFERVGGDSGSLPDVVTALCQDRAGFLWIGSRRGLYLYDGYAFREFKSDAGDKASISDHAIRTIFEDSKGRLWVGTNAGGLELLDRARWTFTHHRHDSKDPGSISHDSVNAIAEGKDGSLWVATQQGLNRFDPATGRFETVNGAPVYALTIRLDRKGRLWIATPDAGLFRLDPATGGLETFRHDPADPKSISSSAVFEILEDPKGRIWIGTAAGLDLWEPSTRSFVHTAVRDVEVASIVPAPSGRLWIGTFGGGLCQLDPDSGEVLAHRPDPARRDALASDRVLALLAESDGTLWVGSWGGGLQRIAPAAVDLAARAERSRLPAGLASPDVGALYAAHDGSLWIGTSGGEVVRRRFLPPSDRRVLSNMGQVLAMTEDSRGRTWIGSSARLACLGPEPGARRDFVHDDSDPTSLGPGYVRAVVEDAKGAIWVGTGEGGVQRLDPDGKVRVRFVSVPDDPRTLSDDYVTGLRFDRHGTLWVGTRAGGLNALDPESGAVVRCFGHRTVTAILEDRSGRLWVATAGGGLQLVERTGDAVSFRRYTQAEGLVDDDVVGMIEDDDGSLWLSTRKGLARFDPASGSIANYGAAEGIPAGEFEVGSAARTRDTLFFGGVRGIVAVPAGMKLGAVHPSPTVLTAIRSAAGDLASDRPAWEVRRMVVPYGTWLAVEMAVLDFDAPDRKLYAYRLGGVDQPWVDLGPRRSVTFASLAPGMHRFSARGRNGRGVWSEMPSLEIVVPPPYWMTWWFRLGASAAVAGGALAAHRVRTASLARRNRQLVELQAQRERAQAELRAAYDRLRHLTRRFEAAKEEERKRIARELHDDLGPSLTAVIINLQLLADPARASGSAKRLAESTELVDRIIQQIRDLSLALRPPLLDEMGLVPALKGYLETTAERTGLDLTFRGDPALAGLAPEVEITAFRVAQEAITNVVRHAGARRATTSIERANGRLVVTVEDDGAGFDVAATMASAATGNAVGLLGMRERVLLLGGDLAIDAAPGRGTRVRAELPLESAS